MVLRESPLEGLEKVPDRLLELDFHLSKNLKTDPNDTQKVSTQTVAIGSTLFGHFKDKFKILS